MEETKKEAMHEEAVNNNTGASMKISTPSGVKR